MLSQHSSDESDPQWTHWSWGCETGMTGLEKMWRSEGREYSDVCFDLKLRLGKYSAFNLGLCINTDFVCAIWHRFQVRSMKKCKGTAKCNEACFSVLQRGGSQSLCALEEEVYLCVQNERQPPHWSSGPVCLQGVSQEGTPVKVASSALGTNFGFLSCSKRWREHSIAAKHKVS